MQPTAYIPTSRSVSSRRVSSHQPHFTPRMTVPIAGTVVSSRSGSQVLELTQSRSRAAGRAPPATGPAAGGGALGA
jgi:hypothetical protein